MRKFLTVLLCMTIAVCTVFSAGGCSLSGGPSDQIITASDTLNIRIRKGGHGTAYIEELAKAFEAAFADEGYKVNVLTPREDLISTVVYQDIYSDSGVDVYFTENITAELGAAGTYGQTFADITESVYKQKPIKADGTEEELTIEEKLSEFRMTNCFHDGKIYGLPYVYSVGGLAVNTKVLSKYNLETPRTTKEMFDAADKIMKDALATDTFPFTFSLSANNYTSATLTTWMAQYGGMQEYESFWSFQESDGAEMATDCYKVFAYESVEKGLEVAFHFFDKNMEAYNSASQNFSGAQNQLMRGTAVFYSVGDWMLNEEFARNRNYLNDVTIVNAPLISALGTKLFGAGTAYNFDEDKCDEVLSAIAKYCDGGKLAAQIKPLVDSELSVNLAIEDVTTVCERRGYVRSDPDIGVIVSEKSQKKDLAALFLRFCASDDGGKIFAREAHTTSVFAPNAEPAADYAWSQSVYNIVNNPYAQNFVYSCIGYRKRMGINQFLPSLGDPYSTYLQGKVSKYDDDSLEITASDNVYAAIAHETSQKMYNYAKTELEAGRWVLTSGK